MQIFALVLKNLTLKRRSKLSTACEILFPMVVALALVLVRQLAVGPAKTSTETAAVTVSDTWFLGLQPPYGDCVVTGETEDLNTPASFAIAPASLGAEFTAFVTQVSVEPWKWSVKLVENDADIEEIVAHPDYPMEGGVNTALCGALVFEPDESTYTIRFNSTFDAGTGRNFYTYSGFNQLQALADDFLYKRKFGALYDESVSTNAYSGSAQRPWYVMNPVPDQRVDEDMFLQIAGIIIVNPLFFVFSLSVSRVVSLVVGERESKSREMMRMMGLRETMFYLSWLFTYVIVYGLIAIGVSLLLYLGEVFPKTDMGILFIHFFLFGLGSAAFSLMLSAPFDTARTATMAGTAGYFFLSFLIIVLDPEQALSANIGLSLLPQVAFTLGIRTIVEAEKAQVGLTWSSLGDRFGNYQMSWFFLMLVCDVVVYLGVYVYLDLVLPHKYGARMSWNFCCQRRRRQEQAQELQEQEQVVEADEGAVIEKYGAKEEELLESGACVWARKLQRHFNLDGGVVKAVDGVSLAMFKEEIFALLGHNGAGKSTLINILVGLFQPSGGRASILGHDVEKELDAVRASMGFCPQHDILWEDLTVWEHLRLYGQLRGMSLRQIRSQASELVAEVGLQKKMNVQSKDLSGGMKRRLSIAISFVGKGAFVILDEPTSGLDPYSRRAIWDLLKRKKEGRILCLSTHYMDEAELLGDRVAIMALGKVKAYGSSLFLKSAFQCGYDLTFVKTSEAVSDAPILAALATRIQNFVVTSVQDVTDSAAAGAPAPATAAGAAAAAGGSTELRVQVPFSSAVHFKPLLEGMDRKSLGIKTFGITSTKLEDVFLKVAGEGDILRGLVRQQPASNQAWTKASEDSGGLGSRMAQSAAECRKRVRQAQRDGKGFACVFLLPILMVVAGLALGLVAFLNAVDALDLSKPVTNGKIAYAFDQSYATGQTQATVVTEAGTSLGLWPGVEEFPFDSTIPSDATGSNEMYSCGANWPADNVACAAWYNFAKAVNEEMASGNAKGLSTLGGFVVDKMMNEASAPRYMIYVNATEDSDAYGKIFNLVNNAVLRWRYNDYENDATFADTTIGDYRTKSINHPLPLTYPQNVREQYGPENNVVTYVMIGMGFIMASIALAVVKERFVGVKEQEFISGLRPWIYWSSRYFIDLVLYFPIAGLTVLAFMAFDVDHYLIDLDGVKPLAAVLFAYGPPAIAFTYWCSFLFKTPGVGQGVTLGIHNITGLILSIVSNVLRIPSIGKTANDVEESLRPLFRIFPSFSMCNSVYNLLVTRGLVPRPDVWDMEVTGWDLIAQGICFVAYVLLTLMAETLSGAAWMERLRARWHATKQGGPKQDEEEQAVLDEQQRVRELGKNEALLIIKDVKKAYGSVQAVRGVSVACGPGEVLGWLGLNGSGKTSSLKIAVGQVKADSGQVLIHGHDIKKELVRARKFIGYCPQDNAIIDELSVMEHVELFAGLKGVSLAGEAGAEVTRWLDILDLAKFKHTRAGTLSGGNKRKLSVAIAMIGNPSVVFLDEPSAGMDPVARRFMWQAIKEISSEKKRCVVITTHSMEEAEALSTKIAIMASGKFKCLGTVQELKDRYGQGYELVLRCRAPDTTLTTGLLDAWGWTKEQRLTKADCMQRITNTEADSKESEAALGKFGLSRVALFEKELNAEVVSAAAFAEWWLQTNTLAAIFKFAAAELPGTPVLLENVGRMLKFAIRGERVGMLDIFELIETRKEEVGVEEYSINQYSLEQIFNDFAKKDVLAVAASLET